MWVFITRLNVPVPPQPQVPHGLEGLQNIDEHVDVNDLPVSYCEYLCDPNVHDYDWVDEELRKTIYKCMYHRPRDRPTLER